MSRKLSESEKKILSMAQIRADLSSAQLARELGMKETTVRNSLQLMRDRRVILQKVLINTLSLGMLEFGLFFTIDPKLSNKVNELLDYLVKLDRVVLVETLAGPFQFCVIVYASEITNMNLFVSELSARFPRLFVKKKIAIRTSLVLKGFSFMDSSEFKQETSHLRVSSDIVKRDNLDELDHKILEAISEDGELTNRKIAMKLKTSPSTVDYRITRLKNIGIIVGSFYVLNVSLVKLYSYRILIETSGMTSKDKRKILLWFQQSRNIVLYAETLGEWDFEICLVLDEPHQLPYFLANMRSEFSQSITDVHLLTIYDTYKIKHYPFVSPVKF